ncbi:hypothetical protein T459_04573 [Capsicum annuum]|uniref:WPP domain-containing protein n=1 Tax=Capsicum annuum TaxID=4072 RepID=A0A2G3A5J5_CAPAN|nr:hypothetical protein T459_04573 [Capsicum annuum]
MVSQISISYSNSPSYPPIQCTYDTIINHLTESLSTSLIISKHCEIPLQDKASDVAKQIEEKAFVVTGFMTNNNDGGIEIHKNGILCILMMYLIKNMIKKYVSNRFLCY